MLVPILVFSSIGCSGMETQQAKLGVLKQSTAKILLSGNINSKGSTGRTLPTVELPLMLWSSFEYKDISKPSRSGHTKEIFCAIKETEGIPVQAGNSVKFLGDAECLYTYFTSHDGVPHKYWVGLVKVRMPETGKEAWTWRTSV